MKSVAPFGFVAILFVSLCSCSGPSDTAQVPELAPIDLQATRQPKKTEETLPLTDSQQQPDIEQPASIMARQLKDFGAEVPNYAGDSFFETQTSFEVPVTDDVSVREEVDFSGNLIGN